MSGPRRKRKFVDDHFQLTVNELRDANALIPGYAITWQVTPQYKLQILIDDKGLLVKAHKPIYVPFSQSTPYRGIRYWFSCPQCSRRCGILYLPHLICRVCAHLTYHSQSQPRPDLAAHKLAQRLKKIEYKRLLARHTHLERLALAKFA